MGLWEGRGGRKKKEEEEKEEGRGRIEMKTIKSHPCPTSLVLRLSLHVSRSPNGFTKLEPGLTGFGPQR